MEKSTILISLTLFTLLCGIVIASYQLWMADREKKAGTPSALTPRYAGQPTSRTVPPGRTAYRPAAARRPAPATMVEAPAASEPVSPTNEAPQASHAIGFGETGLGHPERAAPATETVASDHAI